MASLRNILAIACGARALCVIQHARSRLVDIQADNIIDQGDIAQTERLIRPPIRRTPVIQVDAADFGLTAARLSFKLELLQHAGSFKTRGALANLLTREIPPAGVVAASGGTMGRRWHMRR